MNTNLAAALDRLNRHAEFRKDPANHPSVYAPDDFGDDECDTDVLAVCEEYMRLLPFIREVRESAERLKKDQQPYMLISPAANDFARAAKKLAEVVCQTQGDK